MPANRHLVEIYVFLDLKNNNRIKCVLSVDIYVKLCKHFSHKEELALVAFLWRRRSSSTFSFAFRALQCVVFNKYSIDVGSRITFIFKSPSMRDLSLQSSSTNYIWHSMELKFTCARWAAALILRLSHFTIIGICYFSLFFFVSSSSFDLRWKNHWTV